MTTESGAHPEFAVKFALYTPEQHVRAYNDHCRKASKYGKAGKMYSWQYHIDQAMAHACCYTDKTKYAEETKES